MSHPPAEFPFWVNSSVRSAPPWVTRSDKPSCRHTICCGIVGLALAWGEIAKFTTLFAHPQLTPATTKNHTPCCPLRHAHPILVPKGVLYTVGMSMWSALFSFTQSAQCALGQFTKSLHMHTGLTANFPMDGAPLCAHHTPFPLTFCQFSHTQVLPHMFRIRSHHCIWTQLPTLSPTSWSDPASTLAPEALLLGGWHTHWRPTTTPQLPPATFRSRTCAHLHLWPDRAAFGPARPSLPFQLPGTHVDPLFCQPGPFTASAPPRAPFCAPLHTSAHLCAPLHTFVLHLSWACHPYPTFL